jgi:transmembrane 9 superfamily member 1
VVAVDSHVGVGRSRVGLSRVTDARRLSFVFSSTGAFVFLYAVFFYFNRSKMRGTLQTLQFFGYTSIACYVFFLMLGTVGFFSSLRFIRYIYVNIKMD